MMTKAEFEARKRWDTSLTTDTEKKNHKQHILSMYGSVKDETFIEPHDSVPEHDNRRAEYLRTIRALYGSITDETFKRHPEIPFSTCIES